MSVFQACVDQKCTDVSVFGVDDCRSKCHHHGVSDFVRPVPQQRSLLIGCVSLTLSGV